MWSAPSGKKSGDRSGKLRISLRWRRTNCRLEKTNSG